jgi:hypothetical protein
MTDFSKYPQSISAIKAKKTEYAGDWTPRDALIEALRQIDSGEIKPDVVVICYREPNEEKKTVHTNWFNTSGDHQLALGLLFHVMHRIMEDGKT